MSGPRKLPRHLGGVALSGLALIGGSCRQAGSTSPEAPAVPLSLTHLLAGGDVEGYARAFEPRPFTFPEDHGAHPDFRTEWWYLTGNLATAGGRRFGYQFTLFRNAIAPSSEERPTNWATNQVYMAHLAVTDVEGKAFHAFERLSRGAIELAGVETRPFRAWLEDWQLFGDDPPPFHLWAVSDGIGVDLDLDSAKPLVLQGDRGLSQKGREPGNASYYYSYTRMPTRGTVAVGYKSFEVQGSSWLDREWSTSALEESQTGWDWFALQLSDGRDVMVYRLRRADARSDPASGGTLVAVDGSTTRFAASDFKIEERRYWTSPATGARYPSEWRLQLADPELDLQISPLLPDQELRLSVRYWEGTVIVSGTSSGQAVSGRGYVELTGYD